MVYRVKFKDNKKIKGFTLIELLITISIFAIILSISTSSFNNFKSHSNLEIVTNGVVEAIRFAESSSVAGKNDSDWGVKIFSNKLIIFKGSSYENRDYSFDETLNFTGGVIASGISEIVFNKITGLITESGDIMLSNNTKTKTININEKGTITY